MAGSRTIGDWIWTIVGLAGVACIVVAIYMFIPRSNSPEDIAKLVEEHYLAGEEMLRAGNAEGAVEEFSAAAGLVDGRNPLVQNRLGESLLAVGKADEAARCWFAALSLAPLFPAPYENLAKWFMTREEFVAAASFYRTAKALYLTDMPANLEARRQKAAEAGAGPLGERLEKARKDYAANPANQDALTVLLLHQLAEVRVADDAAPAEGLRTAVLALGGTIADLDARIGKQREACADREESVVDRAGLGLLLLLSGDAKAKEEADRAFELSAADPAALFGVALVDLLAGTSDLARIEQAANRMNGNPVLWLALGAAAITAKKEEVARGALTNVLRLQPFLAALPAIPENYRLHALALTDPAKAADREKFLKAYARFFE
jgi:tetratricopeptide (TPR) repeat protein